MDQILYRGLIEDDSDQIITLIREVMGSQENFLIERDRKWWEWKYNSFFGESIKIIAEYRKEVVGVRLLWPWDLMADGKVTKAFHPVDTVVKDTFRGKGIFSAMTLKGIDIARSQKAGLIYNFPNQNSLPGYLKLGWTYVGKLPWYVKILRPAYLYSKKYKNIDARSVPLELPENFRLTTERLREINFNEDDGDLIKTKRSPEYYNWRFIQHPVFHYGVESIGKGNKSISCIYFTSRYISHIEFFIVDIIGDRELVPRLLKGLSSLMRELNVSVGYCMDNNGLLSSANLLRFGYVKMKNKNFVCMPLESDPGIKALDIRNWQITGAMHDTL